MKNYNFVEAYTGIFLGILACLTIVLSPLGVYMIYHIIRDKEMD